MIDEVELRHLLTLRAVVEAGTFAKAATRLGYTQSAVSQQIAVLERMVGYTLFDRPKGPKPPVLTMAGRLVLARGREIERSVASLSRDLEDLEAGKAGRLRLGTFPSVSARIVPEVIAAVRQAAPDVVVELIEDNSAASGLQPLTDGDLDMCFLVTTHPGLTQRLVLEDEYVVMTRADQATSEATIPLDQVMAGPILGMPSDDICATILESGLRRLGYEPSWVYRSGDNHTIQSMARSGLGRGIMPMLAVDVTDEEVSFQRTDPPLPVRSVYVSRLESRTLSPVEQLVWDAAITAAANVARHWQ